MTETKDEATLPILPSLEAAGRSILFYDARTPKAFLPRPVTEEELRRVWDLARWPPTSMNSQPLRILFVRSAAARKRLVTHMWAPNRAKVEAAPVTAVLAWDTRFHDRCTETAPDKPGLREMYDSNERLHRLTGEYNGALQAAYFLLAVRATGLGAGPMSGFDAESLDDDFFPDGHLKSQLVVNIGHPDPRSYTTRQLRLDADDVLRWI
ncbi:malonic semialdehyde reductase [Actinomadura madurae]|uniref:3-hydroxypropanoate dehydrogenase n=1 Tax=Actinomadura madurae TaxID=1993 RepID=A0A1I5X7R4_9ACTN|nr:malonic semialdehyde reductase [Actinomadura madurae]SFQ28010.1 3-hydroxypropanoate dehydrogenase [Actinomadura madurae]SPT59128.1 Probable malonic semialdehyde reductase RutE [Actinomadura madurae]